MTASDPSLPADVEARGRVAGRLWILAAALLWSTSGFYAKHPTFLDWPQESSGLLLAFWRALFAGLLLLPLARRPEWRWQLLPMTLCFALMNAAYLSSMTLTTAANAIWLQSTAPVWVFLVGVLLLHERPTRGDLLLLAFGAAGVGTILWFELQQSAQLAQRGVWLGLASGVFYAGVVLFMRMLRGVNSAFLVSLNLLVTAAAILPAVLRIGIWPSGWQWLILMSFGLLQMGLPYVMFAHGLRKIPSQEAAGIALVEPVLVPIWIVLFPLTSLPEMPAAWTIIGGSLIFAGLIVRYAGAALARNKSGHQSPAVTMTNSEGRNPNE